MCKYEKKCNKLGDEKKMEWMKCSVMFTNSVVIVVDCLHVHR